MRIFFDSSVLIAALTHSGICSQVLLRAIAVHLVFVSEYVLEEVRRTLLTKFHSHPADVAADIQWLRTRATVVLNPPLLDIVIRDPNDIPIVSAAIAVNADILVSGDKDLLELPNPPMRILSPRTLHDLIMPR